MDLFEAADTRELARQGMQQAVDHADAVEPSWSERATACLRDYAHFNREFMAEDLRTWAHRKVGLPYPPDPRAWGSILQRACKARLIVRDRFESTKIPPAHAKPMAVWRSLIHVQRGE